MKKIFILSLFLLLTGCTAEGNAPVLNYPAQESVVAQEEVVSPKVEEITETKEEILDAVIQKIVETPVAPVVSTPAPVVEPVLTPETNSTLSNDNYYTNVDGNIVHSPAYSSTIPPGATAICKDGTYSFSQNRRGTCSGHGGVAEWL